MHHAAVPSLHPAPLPFEPTEDEIQKRAYFLWKEEGSPAGRDLDIWLKARELIRHQVPPRPAPRGRRRVAA